jgi:glucose-6-phosphate 1-dehydrogenase
MVTEPELLNEENAFIIFGVTGDLTRRKLIPALYELESVGRLSKPFHIIGFARRDWTNEFLKSTFQEGINEFARTKPVNISIQDFLNF